VRGGGVQGGDAAGRRHDHQGADDRGARDVAALLLGSAHAHQEAPVKAAQNIAVAEAVAALLEKAGSPAFVIGPVARQLSPESSTTRSRTTRARMRRTSSPPEAPCGRSPWSSSSR